MNEDLTSQIPVVYKFALRLSRGNVHQAEDILQETMLRAIKSFDQLIDEDRLRSWLLSIAVNVNRDRGKKLSAQRESPDQELAEQVASSDIGDKQVELDELWQQAMHNLDRLPTQQRSVLYLHACEQLNLDQIADVLGITKSAAKANLSLARAKLATRLGLTKYARPSP